MFQRKSYASSSTRRVSLDSDLVNLESDIDISHALSISNTLKLFIFDTSMTFIPSNLSQCAPEAAYLLQLNTSDSSRDQIKTHLKEIRDQITRLLDRLDDSSEPSRGNQVCYYYRVSWLIQKCIISTRIY